MTDYDLREMDNVPPANILDKIRNWWNDVLWLAAQEGDR